MHRLAIVIATLALLHCSCATLEVPTPPVVVHTSEGDASAYSDEDAQRIAALLVDLAPKVRAVLVDVRSDPVDVRVLDHEVSGFEDPCNYERVIVIPACPREMERMALAHELVHWQLAGVWRMLPYTAQEGLADRIALDLTPEMQLNRTFQCALALFDGSVRDPIEAFSLNGREWWSLHERKRDSALYAMAFVVVTRVGIEPLRELCAKANAAGLSRVPPEWLLAAANLSSRDVWDWEIKMTVPFPPGAQSMTIDVRRH
jgi:hypothetical protein